MHFLACFVLLVEMIVAGPLSLTARSNATWESTESLNATSLDANTANDEPIIPRGLTVKTELGRALIFKHQYIFELVSAIYNVARHDLTVTADDDITLMSDIGRNGVIYFTNVNRLTDNADLAGALFYILQWTQRGEPARETGYRLLRKGQRIGYGQITSRDVPRFLKTSNQTVSSNATTDANNSYTSSTSSPLNDTRSGLTSNSNITSLGQTGSRCRFDVIEPVVDFSTYPFQEIIAKTILALAYLHQDLPMVGKSSIVSFTGIVKATFAVADNLPPEIPPMYPSEAREAFFFLASYAFSRRLYVHSEVIFSREILGHFYEVGKVIIEPTAPGEPAGSSGTPSPHGPTLDNAGSSVMPF